uniref:Uncharacterized protein n=1 Tax=Salmo trutta TaxID=8032 RepID=A0A674CH38_SALTR
MRNMAATADHFMYFAFGSNLLKERLQLANPSAIFHCTGRLKVIRSAAPPVGKLLLVWIFRTLLV